MDKVLRALILVVLGQRSDANYKTLSDYIESTEPKADSKTQPLFPDTGGVK